MQSAKWCSWKWAIWQVRQAYMWRVLGKITFTFFSTTKEFWSLSLSNLPGCLAPCNYLEYNVQLADDKEESICFNREGVFLAVFLQPQNWENDINRADLLFYQIHHVIAADWLVYFAFREGELKSSPYDIQRLRFNNAIWFTSGYGQDKKFWCDGVEHISLCSCRDGGTGTAWSKLS